MSRTRAPHAPLILSSHSSRDQRDAVVNALEHRFSVIDGPPGTGKTNTILNLVANVLMRPDCTGGILSFNNQAVDIVLNKLHASGIGFVAAWLGNNERVRHLSSPTTPRQEALSR